MKPSILSSLRNTLGRRKGSDVKVQLQQVVRNGDNVSDHSNYSNEQLCDNTPAIAKYAYSAQQPDELNLSKSERVMVLEKSSDGWWKGRKDNNETGWFPSNYVKEEGEIDTNAYSSPAEAEEAQNNIVIDTVVTVYPFSSSNREELSFNTNETLEILEKPTVDPEWWRARNQVGELGLIPRNYVRSLASKDSGYTHTPQSQSDCSISTSQGGASSSRTSSSTTGGGGVRAKYNVVGPFSGNDWFWGNISRADAEQMFNQYAENGDFLLRISETNVSISQLILHSVSL